MEHLSHPGKAIPYEAGDIQTSSIREATKDALIRIAHWQPKRTHEIGKDEKGNVRDFVAVWRHS